MSDEPVAIDVPKARGCDPLVDTAAGKTPVNRPFGQRRHAIYQHQFSAPSRTRTDTGRILRTDGRPSATRRNG